ncbi:MAG: fumarate hydratase [Clostridia bacterium]|nr:fumarate hydratase [Clostridia bacterium]
MREISSLTIESAVAELCIRANRELPSDIAKAISKAEKKENNSLAKSVLSDLEKNISCAKELDVPICQDTGMAVVFAEIGQDVHITGKSFEQAINDGVKKGYEEGLLRKSVVCDPLRRVNTNDNTPAIIHTKIVDGDKIKITVAPKGFGSENMSGIRMLTPAHSREGVVKAVLDIVVAAGANPCPPIVVGVGIGGDFEQCALLAKKALSRDISKRNDDLFYAELEEELLKLINATNIGPQGFGGNTTALAVNIETAPTHIAGLPVAVNIGCHVTRHATKII